MKKIRLEHIATIIRLYLFLSILLFSIYLLAPLFGGKYHGNAIILYGSWIGLALTMIAFLKKKQQGKNISLIEFLFAFLYFSVCMFIWFSLPVNIIFCLLGGIGMLVGYKTQTGN
jgi:membrane protease YdiL (CAAX protease family)